MTDLEAGWGFVVPEEILVACRKTPWGPVESGLDTGRLVSNLAAGGVPLKEVVEWFADLVDIGMVFESVIPVIAHEEYTRTVAVLQEEIQKKLKPLETYLEKCKCCIGEPPGWAARKLLRREIQKIRLDLARRKKEAQEKMVDYLGAVARSSHRGEMEAQERRQELVERAKRELK